MVDISEAEVKPKRDGRGRKIFARPTNPLKVLDIVRLRDVEHLTWEAIKNIHGGSRQGPYSLYKRWHDWAVKERGNGYPASGE